MFSKFTRFKKKISEISTNFAKNLVKKSPNFRYHKTGKEKENPTSLAEQAEKEETTMGVRFSHVLDNPHFGTQAAAYG